MWSNTRRKLMRFPNLILSFVFCLTLIIPSFLCAQTAPLGEKEKIEALIKVVSQLKTAKFVRNGWTYSADTAATFLRSKWQANDSVVKSARDFIDRVATVSGTSGKPYLVRMKDGTEIPSRQFLFTELKKLETVVAEQHASGG
jgi:hypothetical protein